MGCCFSADNEEMESKRKRTFAKGPIDENTKPKKRIKKEVIEITDEDSDGSSDVAVIDNIKNEQKYSSLSTSSFSFPSTSSDNSGEGICGDEDISVLLDNSRLWALEDVISEQANIRRNVASNILKLFDQDCTIPFIARYRSEMTGGLDAEKLREVQEAYSTVKVVKKKVETIAKTLSKENKLDGPLVRALSNATTLTEVEHLYAPFKPGSKKSLAEKSRQLGLEPSALKILFNQAGPMEFNAANFVNKSIKDLDAPEKVCLGWQRIMADVISKDQKVLDFIKQFYKSRMIEITATKSSSAEKQDKKAETEGSSTNSFKFENYFNFKNSISNVDSHQILALNRGEKQKVLTVKIVVPNRIKDDITNLCWSTFPHNYNVPAMQQLFHDTLQDSYQRLIEPLICRHVRSNLTKMAEKESVKVFCANLKQLLLTPPIRGHTVLGVDPGFSHGCKCAVVSSKGEVLFTDVVYLHGDRARKYSNQAYLLRETLLTYNVETIALGNGTACRETEEFLSNLIKEDYFKPLKVHYCIVDESGVSIYSVTKEAEAEMPLLDPNRRSAVGLARRLQDPLLEYVKIDPKHLGVGQYQHDLPESMLKTALDEVMIECVSFVGADLNVSSELILRKVAGLTPTRAKSIIKWREENGCFKNRQQLMKVKGLGPKTFEQCAGFVKIIPQTAQDLFIAKIEKNKNKLKTDAEDNFNPLDMTVIHPESYKAATTFLNILDVNLDQIGTESAIKKVDDYMKKHSVNSLAEILSIPPATMQLIADALKQSITYDIRSEMGQPLFKTGIIMFENLKIGQKLTGRVQNNTTFGAFVDVGVGCSGLIHKSNMKNQVLQLNDRVEVEIVNLDIMKKRIGLKLLSKGLIKLGSEELKSAPNNSRPIEEEMVRNGSNNQNSNLTSNSSCAGSSRFGNRKEARVSDLNLHIGQVLNGVVKNVQPYGAFINIGMVRDGLLHSSKMYGSRLQPGDKVSVSVLEIDYPRNRISLGLAH